MKNITYLLFIVLNIISFNSLAISSPKTLLSCENCTSTKLETIIDDHVQSSRLLSPIVIIDAAQALATEVTLRPAGAYDPNGKIYYSYEITTNETYLRDASAALLQINTVNTELINMSQLGGVIPAKSGFVTVADVLLERLDFERYLADRFNSDISSTLNEIARRADNQLVLLSSSLGFSVKVVSASLGHSVKDSSWVVTLSDDSTIVVDISFKLVADKLSVVTTADPKTAYNKDGVSVPLSTGTVDNFKFAGNYQLTQSYADYLRNMGVTGSIPYVSGHINCTVSKTRVPYSNRFTIVFKCEND